MSNVKKKIRVAVLYGGRSGEHEVSLHSAASVIKNLNRERFEIVPIGIDKQGRWLLNNLEQMKITADTKLLVMPSTAKETLPTLIMHKEAQKVFDVAFPVMHGTLCEDGTLQGLLELMDVPYVGAGVLGSAIGMDKDVAKRLVSGVGIPVAHYLCIKQGAWLTDPAFYIKTIAENLEYPVFVKPANTGSSVGIHKVKQVQDLTAAINDAFLYDVKVLVEQALNAREIELSVLENNEYGKPPLVSVAGEIVPSHEFYSYTAKYLDEHGAQLLIPAPLTAEQLQRAQQLAGRIFEVLECEGMARVDLFLDKHTDEFYFNEVNTIPGFTQISMYPKLWEASGLAYSDLLTRLIELALARHQRKQHLKREWALPEI
jgi:D-alanine-D-alanine ligase